MHFLQSFTKYDFYVVLFVLAYIFLTMKGKLPAVESIRRLLSALDDRGGNIFVLSFFSLVFFFVTVNAFYYAIGLISNGKIDAKDAIMLMMLSWLTGNAFGMSSGALLKTMRGDLTTNPPSPDFVVGQAVTSTKTETTKTDSVPPVPPVVPAPTT